MSVSSVETGVHRMSDSAIGIKEQEEISDAIKAPTSPSVDPDKVLEEAKEQLARANELRAKEAANYLSELGGHHQHQPLLEPKDFIQRKIAAIKKFLLAPTSEEIHQD